MLAPASDFMKTKHRKRPRGLHWDLSHVLSVHTNQKLLIPFSESTSEPAFSTPRGIQPSCDRRHAYATRTFRPEVQKCSTRNKRLCGQYIPCFAATFLPYYSVSNARRCLSYSLTQSPHNLNFHTLTQFSKPSTLVTPLSLIKPLLNPSSPFFLPPTLLSFSSPHHSLLYGGI